MPVICQYELRNREFFRLASNAVLSEDRKVCDGEANSALESVFVRVAMGYELEGVNAGKEGHNHFRVEVMA